jgi:hypothetical protein
MSAVKNLDPVILFTGSSLAASFNSKPIPIPHLDNIGIELDVTAAASLSGIVSIQISASYAQDSLGNVLNAGTWITLMNPSGSPVEATVTTTGAVYFDLNQLSAPWIRLVWTASSGTGTANGLIAAKHLGG